MKKIPFKFFKIIMYTGCVGLFIFTPLWFISPIIDNPLLTMITEIIGKTSVALSIFFCIFIHFAFDDESSENIKLIPPDEYNIEVKSIMDAKEKIKSINKRYGYFLLSDDIKTEKYEVNIFKKEEFECFNIAIVVYTDVLKASICDKFEEEVNKYLKKITPRTISSKTITIYCVKEKSLFLKSLLSNYNGPALNHTKAYLGVDIKNKKLYLCKNNFNDSLYRKIKKELDNKFERVED